MTTLSHQNVLRLIQELKEINTIGRVFHYGPLDTLALALSRVVNHEIINYYSNYLETLDDAIIYFNSTKYKVSTDRYTLGELYNATRLTSAETLNDDARIFFINFYKSLNLITLEVIKAGVDELFDNNFKLDNVNSLRALASLNYNSPHYSHIKNIIKSYYETILNKPFGPVNIISYLKRYRLDTNFISDTVTLLETEVVNYIKLKYSMSSTNSTLNIFKQ